MPIPELPPPLERSLPGASGGAGRRREAERNELRPILGAPRHREAPCAPGRDALPGEWRGTGCYFFYYYYYSILFCFGSYVLLTPFPTGAAVVFLRIEAWEAGRAGRGRMKELTRRWVRRDSGTAQGRPRVRSPAPPAARRRSGLQLCQRPEDRGGRGWVFCPFPAL